MYKRGALYLMLSIPSGSVPPDAASTVVIPIELPEINVPPL